MSSIGASSAAVYVQQKRLEDKLKRAEEGRERKSGEGGVEKTGSLKGGKTKKVHPGGSPPSLNTVGKLGKEVGF
ncbi:hypothetical protein RHMOL_Rhmol08G0010200 [Rhododendron molle]|uniref:Uncharacterized protein n=1 Tax=Rhododendron molle TaxID=49168 RepID=A0ACC0MIA1_RHOML|nr:hypothetical protein RHMOL_Rhmol08G0010200 [Rhododendron molle]